MNTKFRCSRVMVASAVRFGWFIVISSLPISAIVTGCRLEPFQAESWVIVNQDAGQSVQYVIPHTFVKILASASVPHNFRDFDVIFTCHCHLLARRHLA